MNSPIEILNSNNIVIYSNRMVDHQSHTLQLWTVNDAKLADKMVRRGATSIITDRPQAFVNWINQKQPANDGFMQKIKPLAWLQSKITH